KGRELKDVGKTVLTVHWSELYSTAQVRKRFRNLEALGQSMKDHGQDHPIRVSPKDKKGYKIKKGERRWRAAQIYDLHVDILVDERDQEEVDEIIGQLIENIQRDDLSPLEQAEAYDVLRQNGMSQAEIAQNVGKSESTISKHLSLLRMPECITELVESEIIRDLEIPGILRKIHELDPERCEQICANAINEGITRSYAEAILRDTRGIKSDVDREQTKERTATVGNADREAESEYNRELKDAGLDEESEHVELDGLDGDLADDEQDPSEKPRKKDVPEPKSSGYQPGDEVALKNKDGFYERNPEHAKFLCQFIRGDKLYTGILMLHLATDNPEEVVLRCTRDDGKESYEVVLAEEVTIIKMVS